MTNTLLCEKKMSHYTSACFEANNIIARNMREFSSDPSIPNATVVVKRAHDLMLDYVKEATQGLSKMSMNRIRRVSTEKDEWDALQAFENVASEQQKGYARAYCKPGLKSYREKKKNFDLVAARHVPRPRPRPRLSVSVSSVSVCLGLACLGLGLGLGLGSLGPGLGLGLGSRSLGLGLGLGLGRS